MSQHAKQPTSQDLVVQKAQELLAPLAREFGRLCVNKEEIAFGREKLFAMQAIRNSADLQAVLEQDPHSLVDAVRQIAFVGLSLNPLQGHAYLVAHNNKVSRNPDVWKKQAVLFLGYKGLIKLATSGGSVVAFEGGVRYEGEVFEYEKGTSSFLRHLPTAKRDPAKALGAYCIATLAHGQKIPLYLPKDKIMVAREAAKTKAIWDGPSWDEQWIKTAFRNLCKTLPRDGGIDRAIEAIERTERYEEPEPPRAAPAPRQPETKEQIVVLGEKEITELHAACTDRGISSKGADRWLEHLASSEGYESIKHAPLARFAELKAKLLEGLALAEKRRQERAAEAGTNG